MGTRIEALAPLSRCAEICGLSSKEMIVGSRPGPEHAIVAELYFYSPNSRKTKLRAAMVSAIRAAVKDHQLRRAAELFVALRVMLTRRRATRRHDRHKFRQKRWPPERSIESRPGALAPASAIIINFAERSAARMSERASVGS